MSDDLADRIRAAADWFVRDPDTGEVSALLTPNASISVFWAASAVAVFARPPEPWRAGIAVVRVGSLTWWAVDETLRGTSPLRRTLGAVTLAGLVIRVTTHLRRADAVAQP